MTDEQIKKILDDDYDPEREGLLTTMFKDFYSRRMMSLAIIIWVGSLIYIAGAVYSAVKFFDATETRDQILYAALFICFVNFVCLMKIFAWQMIHRNGIKREVKRLELRIAEMAKALDGRN